MRLNQVASILALVFSGLGSSCSRDEDSGSDAGSGRSLPQRPDRPEVIVERSSSDSGAVNPYADMNWSKEEVDNEWTREFESAATSQAKIDVMGRKQSSGPEDLASLMRLALRESDERVRTEAAMMISSFAGSWGGIDSDASSSSLPESEGPMLGEVVDVVVGAAHDSSSEVRILAMEAAVELEPDVQIGIYGRTIGVEDPEVRQMTITELGRIRSKPAFETLITGLKAADPEFRKALNLEMNLLVNRSFQSYEEAETWWNSNSSGFSDNMIDLREDQ